MSVQLIIYPQYYNGTTLVPSSTINMLGDANFLVVNFTSTSVVNGPADTATAARAQSSPIVGVWKGFRSSCTSAPCSRSTTALPYRNLSGLTLTTEGYNAAFLWSRCGAYQRIHGLTVGANYKIEVFFHTVPTVNSGYLKIRQAAVSAGSTNPLSPGPFPATSDLISSTTTSLTKTFTATAIEHDLFVTYWQENYLGGTGEDLIISHIVVSLPPPSSSTVYTNLADGQVLCDLYEDETIPLSLSVDDFTNIAEKTQSYSKAFNLPATKRNNKIFTHIFEITKSTVTAYDFNPYVKTKCVLKEDGLVIFEGFLRLIDIIDKEGEISYNVNLYSEAVSLMDTLKDRKISDLTSLAELDHDYNFDSITDSWTGALTYIATAISGFRTGDTVKYPFVNWNEGYALDANGQPVLKVLEDAFKPFVNIKYLIDVIFEEAGFSYTSDFFNTTNFGKLFMDFNWGGSVLPSATASTLYTGIYNIGLGSAHNYATTSYTNMTLISSTWGNLPPNYDTSTHIITACPTCTNEQYYIEYEFYIRNYSTTDTHAIECRWLLNGVEFEYSGVQPLLTWGVGAYTYSGNFTRVLQPGDTLQAQFRGSLNLPLGITVRQRDDTPVTNVKFYTNISSISTATILDTLRGELVQWDFLKGIMNLFNLVTLPDKQNENNILIEPYADVFHTHTNSGGNINDLTLASRSIDRDWTEKIDIEDIKLNPLDAVKRTIFKFEEDDDDYAFNVFKQNTGNYLYGSKTVLNNTLTLLEGEDEVVASPFAATIISPLSNGIPDLIIPRINTRNEDGTYEGFDNAPRILYNNGVKTLATNTYSVPAQNGVAAVPSEDEFLQFSHLTDVPTVGSTTVDFNFASQQLVGGVGNAPVNNSYSIYYAPYFNELYNPDTRIMTLKVKLNAADINTFNFFDMVMIKNRVFRVNKIDYQPGELSTVEFILIP